jgi:hypothetical protein
VWQDPESTTETIQCDSSEVRRRACLRQSRQVYAAAWPRAASKPGSGSCEMYLEERYARMGAQGDQRV